MTTDPHLRTADLTRRFGDYLALDGVDISVPRNELRGIIGPNGAGKTTFFNLISGLILPSAGRIWYDGEEITTLPAYRIARRGLARTLQIASAFESLSVLENAMGAVNGTKSVLSPVARFRRDQETRDRAMAALERAGLAHVAETRAGDLSHGDARLLELALAMATDPDLLLLDEPTAGLAPGEVHTITDLIEDLAGEMTVLLVEHNMDVVMEIADRLTVLNQGVILAEGTPAEIQTNEQVQDVYFGRR